VGIGEYVGSMFIIEENPRAPPSPSPMNRGTSPYLWKGLPVLVTLTNSLLVANRSPRLLEKIGVFGLCDCWNDYPSGLMILRGRKGFVFFPVISQGPL